MRRSCAALLLGIFGLLFLLPLMQGVRGDASLPACCRRDGRHHCAMLMGGASAPAGTPMWQARTEPCPFCPAAVSPSVQHHLALHTGFALLLPTGTPTRGSTLEPLLLAVGQTTGPPNRGPPTSSL